MCDHRAGDSRVFEFVCKERGAHELEFDCNHDSWHVNHGEEELDQLDFEEEDVGLRFVGGVAVSVA